MQYMMLDDKYARMPWDEIDTVVFDIGGVLIAYTPDKYLGKAYDFEGTYQTHLCDVASGLYIAKEDPDVLMVELKHGEYVDYVILIKEETTD